ncbi:MAG: flagellar brake protein [Oscillospiraceae bacterium]|nr:flagellar brake protein [Oscillospiraceae bacterium]MCL2278261.1 flagellar brake protein [Oscillospiraceae bacterium]
MAKNRDISEDILVIGDKVDVVSSDGQVYRSMVEDRLDDGPFLVSVPHRKGRYMYVSQNDVIYLVFYRESGRYIVQMRVLALEKRGAIRYMWLQQETKAERNQRREAYRLAATVAVVVYEYDSNFTSADLNNPDIVDPGSVLKVLETVASRDISIKGIALSSKKVYTIGDEYFLGMDLDNTSEVIGGSVRIKRTPSITLRAVVRRCIPLNNTKINHVGLSFLDEIKTVNEKIARYVLIEQQRQIKSKRGFN